MEARSFAELLLHICKKDFLFKFSAKHSMSYFGIAKEITKVQFKEHVLLHLPEAQAQSDKKENAACLVKQAVNHNYEDDAIVLKIIHEDIFNSNVTEFNGSFCADCQQQSVPTNLKYFVSMLLNGCMIKDQDSQSCLTILQTIIFNCNLKLHTITPELKRAQKEHQPKEHKKNISHVSTIKPKKSLDTSMQGSKCFLCNESVGEMHKPSRKY